MFLVDVYSEPDPSTDYVSWISSFPAVNATRNLKEDPMLVDFRVLPHNVHSKDSFLHDPYRSEA